jgi:hypothetical protein
VVSKSKVQLYQRPLACRLDSKGFHTDMRKGYVFNTILAKVGVGVAVARAVARARAATPTYIYICARMGCAFSYFLVAHAATLMTRRLHP